MIAKCVQCKKQRPVFHGIRDFRLCRACWLVWRGTVG